jgi:hypothetical protein
VGELLEVRPLKPEDLEELFAVASDPMIWEQHPARDRYKNNQRLKKMMLQCRLAS